MFEKLLRNGTKFSFLPIIKDYYGAGADKLEQATKTEQLADRSVAQNETGWERILRVFRVDEFGNLTFEASSILQTTFMSMFVGAIYGGVMQSRVAYMNFMKTNEATSFTTHLEAKAKLQHAVTTAFGKGAVRVGWRLTLFSTSFVAISTLIQVYRAKYGVAEYVTAGGLTGIMYKFYMGPRGWIVGGCLGSVLGLICGGTTMGIIKLTGISMEEARYWQYQWHHGKKEYYRLAVADYLEKEDFAVIKLHNDAVGEQGKHIDNVDTNIVNSNNTNNDKKDVKTKI